MFCFHMKSFVEFSRTVACRGILYENLCGIKQAAKSGKPYRSVGPQAIGVELGDALQRVKHPSMGIATEIIQRLQLSENRAFFWVPQSSLNLLEGSNFITLEIRVQVL